MTHYYIQLDHLSERQTVYSLYLAYYLYYAIGLRIIRYFSCAVSRHRFVSHSARVYCTRIINVSYSVNDE